jgi:hypothetical protein
MNNRFQGTYTGFRVMVFNATFNKILVILWRSAFLARKPQYLEKTNDLPQFADIIYHMMLYQVHLAMSGIRIHKRCK